MKTKLLLMLFVVMALVAGTAQANMLVNPGFEDGLFTGSNPLPDFWFHYPVWYAHAHTWVEDAVEAHSGERYMKMYNWLVSNTDWYTSGYLGQDVLGVKEDGDYTFTVWAKNDDGVQASEAMMEVDWLGLFDNWVGSDFVAIPVTDSDWIKLEFGTFTAPKGTVAATIWLVAPLGNGLNAICYDDANMLGPDPNVHAGPDMISWVGETVSLPGNYSLEGGYTTIGWTVEPADGVMIVNGDTLEPDVTITLPPSEMDTYKLTLDVDGKYDAMKIDVYPDACAAKLGMGREATDFVGDDCITDLADLDEMLKTWAVDNALTEPLAKPEQEPGTGGIVIINAGFENPVIPDGEWVWAPDWDLIDGEIYVANPSDDLGGDYYDCFGGIAPEGENVGVSGAYKGDDSGLVQVLTETLATNLVYELTVEVGRTSIYKWHGYKVQLLAGGTILAEDDSSLIPVPDTFETSIVTYDSTGADMRLLGGYLEIRLIAISEHSYIEVCFDDVRLTTTAATGSRNPSPVNGAYVSPASELELSWTNTDPNHPPISSVWVDVWIGTDPNNYDGFDKIVGAAENADSVTVNANGLGTYYWRVNSYIYGDPADVNYDTNVTDPNSDSGAFPIIEGAMWRFHAANDIPVLVEAADMITWSGQATQLDPNIVDDGVSDVTYLWSAEPAAGVVASIVFNPNEYVEDPTVTITKDFSILSIANHSFEDIARPDGIQGELTGWTAPDSGARIWNPGIIGYLGYGGVAPDGENIMWVNGVGAASQILADTLTANSTYTLIVDVGVNSYYGGATYKVELVAGETVLAVDDNSIELTPNEFEQTTVTFNSKGVDPDLLGEPLQIRLWCTLHIDFGGEANYDDVHLTVTPDRPFSDAVSTVKLTVLAEDDAGSDKDTVTIDVYDTACSAAITNFGQEIDPGDFDADCDTDLKDFATMAKEWLVNNELTESVPKP